MKKYKNEIIYQNSNIELEMTRNDKNIMSNCLIIIVGLKGIWWDVPVKATVILCCTGNVVWSASQLM